MEIMRVFDFSATWMKWIFQCISTVSFSILLNGSPHGFFRPKCGLRQRYPLSPFLFVLVTEVITWLIHREEAGGTLHGIKIARHAPPITNVLFADDIMLFCQANQREVRQLQKCITTFARWSGKSLIRTSLPSISATILIRTGENNWQQSSTFIKPLSLGPI